MDDSEFLRRLARGGQIHRDDAPDHLTITGYAPLSAIDELVVLDVLSEDEEGYLTVGPLAPPHFVCDPEK